MKSWSRTGQRAVLGGVCEDRNTVHGGLKLLFGKGNEPKHEKRHNNLSPFHKKKSATSLQRMYGCQIIFLDFGDFVVYNLLSLVSRLWPVFFNPSSATSLQEPSKNPVTCDVEKTRSRSRWGVEWIFPSMNCQIFWGFFHLDGIFRKENLC